MADGTAPDDLSALIHWPREERNLEFKASMSWADPAARAKLTKSALALANLRDGGHIVLGVARQPDDTYLPVGMQTDHADSFVQDQLTSFLSEYADPYIEVSLFKHVVNGQTFCIVRVNEFAELPVVCKKDGAERLRRGAMYTRSRRMVETVEVPSHIEMREILDLAIEKRSRTFSRQAERMGFARLAQKNEFVEQIKKLPETDVLRKIYQMGRWRIWIRPSDFQQARFQNSTACRLFMLRNAVSSGGWQYPFADNDAIKDADESVGCEVDFPPHIERWNLFRSGQFVWNVAFAEEFIGTEAWPSHPQIFVPHKGKRYLNILRTLKILTCTYEFAARLASDGILNPGAAITIELHGVDGRELTWMNPKWRLDQNYWCPTEKIEIERSVDPEELKANARELALNATLDIFKSFRWVNPPRALLAEEQTRILAP